MLVYVSNWNLSLSYFPVFYFFTSLRHSKYNVIFIAAMNTILCYCLTLYSSKHFYVDPFDWLLFFIISIILFNKNKYTKFVLRTIRLSVAYFFLQNIKSKINNLSSEHKTNKKHQCKKKSYLNITLRFLIY